MAGQPPAGEVSPRNVMLGVAHNEHYNIAFESYKDGEDWKELTNGYWRLDERSTCLQRAEWINGNKKAPGIGAFHVALNT